MIREYKFTLNLCFSPLDTQWLTDQNDHCPATWSGWAITANRSSPRIRASRWPKSRRREENYGVGLRTRAYVSSWLNRVTRINHTIYIDHFIQSIICLIPFFLLKTDLGTEGYRGQEALRKVDEGVRGEWWLQGSAFFSQEARKEHKEGAGKEGQEGRVWRWWVGGWSQRLDGNESKTPPSPLKHFDTLQKLPVELAPPSCNFCHPSTHPPESTINSSTTHPPTHTQTHKTIVTIFIITLSTI